MLAIEIAMVGCMKAHNDLAVRFQPHPEATRGVGFPSLPQFAGVGGEAVMDRPERFHERLHRLGRVKG